MSNTAIVLIGILSIILAAGLMVTLTFVAVMVAIALDDL